jgi:hypothetical protein
MSSRVTRLFAVIIGIAGIVFLAYALLKPSSSPPDEAPLKQRTLSEELDHFMTDKMNYGVPFARALAEQRIARAQTIAAEHQEYGPMARKVIDTLRQRLEQRTVMP